jgi:dTDP-4-amino-4,6-dideoxygalactose transaminase
MIALARPILGDEASDAVSDRLRSRMLVQGAWVEKFERPVAECCQRAHAVAVSSGTADLYLALQPLGTDCEDDVLCPDLKRATVRNTGCYQRDPIKTVYFTLLEQGNVQV